MLTAKPKPGDLAYEVEWCTEIPVDENGDCIFDAAVYNVTMCRTLKIARIVAKCRFPEDVSGEVKIKPVEYTKDIGWEPCGETEFYHGKEFVR